MATTDLYPPSPDNVPPELTAVSSSYRNRVLVVLGSLMLFFLLYLGLLAGSAYLVYWAWNLPAESQPERRPMPRSRRSDRDNVMVKVIGVAVGSLLFLFLFKGFFKWRKQQEMLRLPVTRAEQPQLFDFIDRLVQETGAPPPHRVYLSPDVNAAVFYNESILSLFLPTRKNLLIGLGLVNVMNLSEFKAVLAHEFGHFSQKSMKLGGYVYTCNRVIGDMVYGRDFFDDLLRGMKGIDLRLAVFVWGFQGIVWVLRQGLEGCFKLINFSNAALSREMEFQADLAAVSITGSDPLIHGLARLELAEQALGLAFADLRHAADHQVYTDDIFLHQARNLLHIRNLRNDPHYGQPPPLPADPGQTVQVFQEGDGGIPQMWASHPSNFDREINAKRHYIRGVMDERSAWCLFADSAGVRRQVTTRFYELAYPPFDPARLSDAGKVQTFIDDERAETTYDPAYHGLYNDRFIELPDIDTLLDEARAAPWRADQLASARQQLFGDGLKQWVERHTERLQECNLLEGLDRGELQLKGKHFDFRGSQATSRDVKKLLTDVNSELEADQQWLTDHDRRAFLSHYQMAAALGGDRAPNLADRYRFHLGVQRVLRALLGQQASVNAALNYCSSKSELAPEEFQELSSILKGAHDTLTTCQQEAERLSLPAMRNMEAGLSLARFLFTRPVIRRIAPGQTSIDGEWIGKLLEQYGELIDRSRRIHFKSLGGILQMQEAIHAEWTARQE